MSEIDTYLKQASIFQKVTPQQAEVAIEAKTGQIVYIGRETCPYCRRFVAKLSNVAQENQLTIYYLHSQQADTLEAVQALRDRYDVPTVPGFIYSDVQGVHVRCDSSMTEAEILAFVQR